MLRKGVPGNCRSNLVVESEQSIAIAVNSYILFFLKFYEEDQGKMKRE